MYSFELARRRDGMEWDGMVPNERDIRGFFVSLAFQLMRE